MLEGIETAAAALHNHFVGRIVVTGGVGHSTDYLREAVREHARYRDVETTSRSEAAIIADVLRNHHDVPAAAISLEEQSTNCGENARFALELLRRDPPPARSILVIQDPTMQRRTHACFERCRHDDSDVVVLSYAPFVPDANDGDLKDPHGRVVWSSERFTTLVLGEMRRLHDTEAGYGPNGADFIDHIDIPNGVMAAYQRVARDHPESAREARSG